jgi:hypothetical protein
MLVVSQQSLFYLFQKHFSPGHLHVLRLLTAVEMVLRATLWIFLTLLSPRHRPEGRQRLGAYREIFFKTCAKRSYWAPLETRARDRT